MNALRHIVELIAPLADRVKTLVWSGVVHRTDGSKTLPNLQVEALRGQVMNDVEVVEPYGITSSPEPGCEAFGVSPAGDPDRAVILAAFERRGRPTDLAAGDVALWDRAGNRVWLHRGDGHLEVVAVSKFTVRCGQTSMEISDAGVVIKSPGGVDVQSS